MDHSRSLFHSISYVHFNPNPPVKGQKLFIEYGGYLKERLPKGTRINLIASFNSVPVIHKKINLCEDTLKSVGDCPLEPGRYDLTKEVGISEDLPDGNYTVHADIITPQGERVTCLVLKTIL
ncbi:MD-2-related lipid-recognition domain-containing protein [Mucor mucedo]|uniref:MD-2-related lipid-recognition domain-containing protein n=1 Tax=Mucor mucedo TaxID=29922 RepID=UPI00221F41F2|nr:MD-2-related lipid-recognition domain-containing protein [Mucor mucedo]KAI7894188.1 MD-2-related lipid-recognition domain-containing protein [Mucor mucedo]